MAKKRKAGDGLIRQRTDGRWEGRYVVGYDDHGYGWMEYTCAHAMVKYDSNRTALWELNRRTELGLLK